MLRARESITYTLSQKVVSLDSLPPNKWGCAQSMMTYSFDIPWRPLEVRKLCGVGGICVREISSFRRLAFWTDGKSIEVAEKVIGFMAKIPGAWSLPEYIAGVRTLSLPESVHCRSTLSLPGKCVFSELRKSSPTTVPGASCTSPHARLMRCARVTRAPTRNGNMPITRPIFGHVWHLEQVVVLSFG